MKIKKLLMASFLTCLMVGAAAVPASAASLKTLKVNKTYTSYDVTNDGKKDTVKITQPSGEYYMDYKVYVNGKYRFSEDGKGGTMHVYTKGSKGTLILERFYMGSASDYTQYVYKDGKFKRNYLKNGMYFSDMKISGDYIKVIGTAKFAGQLSSFSSFIDLPFKIEDTYKMTKGEFKKTANYAKVKAYTKPYGQTKGTTTFHAKNTFTTGKTRTSVSKKDGIKVKAGQKVELKSYFYSRKTHNQYYKISVNGKTGWFEDSRDIQLKR